MLVMACGVIPVSSTMGALKWFVSWFALVDLFQLKMLNFYLWKTAKVLSGGILYVLWFRGLRAHAGYGPWRSCLWALGFCLLFSSLDEGLPWFFPSRGAGIHDIILDLSGSSLAALLTFAVWTPRTGAVPLITGQHTAGSE